MSIRIEPHNPVPDRTREIALAAFPKGNVYLTLRDQFGVLFSDADFADLYPDRGQPAWCPWRLALITVLQFRETLSDRQAAEAVRARIDWKYLLGLELGDPGFDFSVLSEFRERLIAGKAEDRLLETLLTRCRDQGVLKARGRQRTDSTHVLAAIRELNRLELIGETMRAALNELATIAPTWLKAISPQVWFERYGRRIEDNRLPASAAKRQVYAQMVGEDGFTLLAHLDAVETPTELRELPKVQALRTAWARHFTLDSAPNDDPPNVRFKSNREVAKADEKIESPYDVDARYRSKHGLSWTGYMMHQSETCDEGSVNLITHVHTTPADVHEAMCTETIHTALSKKGLAPKEHVVDAGYISADLLVQSQDDHGIVLIGPPRSNPNWQSRVEGGHTLDRFTIDWARRVVHCPKGVASNSWKDHINKNGQAHHRIRFPTAACRGFGFGHQKSQRCGTQSVTRFGKERIAFFARRHDQRTRQPASLIHDAIFIFAKTVPADSAGPEQNHSLAPHHTDRSPRSRDQTFWLDSGRHLRQFTFTVEAHHAVTAGPQHPHGVTSCLAAAG